MSYVITQSNPCQLVDTDVPVVQEVPAQVLAHGYAGIVRYVPLPGLNSAKDISAAELKGILDAGLALLLVQHVRYQGWNPGKCSGDGDATAAIQAAEAAGYLQGGHIYLDLEGIAGTAADTTAYAQDWSAAIVAAGYCAGCYVGYAVPLNAVQLYDLSNFHTYWSAPGPWKVATRGFAMTQGEPEVSVGDVNFDPDTVQADSLGDTPFWMVNQ
jgi:hypothetical protein